MTAEHSSSNEGLRVFRSPGQKKAADFTFFIDLWYYKRWLLPNDSKTNHLILVTGSFIMKRV